MRLARLRLHHFRTLDDCDITLGDVTVLVGPNDAGKSSVLDAIRCLLSPMRGDDHWDLTDVVPPWTWQDGFEEALRPITIVGDFHDLTEDEQLFYERFVSDGSISIGVSFGGPEKNSDGRQGPFMILDASHPLLTAEITRVAWKVGKAYWLPRNYLARGRRTALSLDLMVKSTGPDRTPVLVSMPGPSEPPPDPMSMLRPFLEAGVRDALREFPDELFALLDQSIAETTYQLSDALTKLAGEYLSSTSRIVVAQGGDLNRERVVKALVDESDDIELHVEHTHAVVTSAWDPKESLVPPRASPVAAMGSGTRRAVALAVLELYANPDFWPSTRSTLILMEEPEVGLHPAAQRRIARSLARYREKHGLQVVLTTHSPVLINAAPGDVMLVSRAEDGDRRHSVLKRPDAIRDVADVLGATPADVLLARKFIVVEGETELRVLPIWAGLLGFDLSLPDVVIVPARGWSPADAVVRLLGIVYPGTSVSVLLDSGPEMGAQARRIGSRHGGRVHVDLLPWPDIEGGYTVAAIRDWLQAEGADSEEVSRALAAMIGDPTKRLVSRLAETLLQRPYRVADDGALIARRMRESDLAPDLKPILLRHFSAGSP